MVWKRLIHLAQKGRTTIRASPLILRSRVQAPAWQWSDYKLWTVVALNTQMTGLRLASNRILPNIVFHWEGLALLFGLVYGHVFADTQIFKAINHSSRNIPKTYLRTIPLRQTCNVVFSFAYSLPHFCVYVFFPKAPAKGFSQQATYKIHSHDNLSLFFFFSSSHLHESFCFFFFFFFLFFFFFSSYHLHESTLST